MVTIFCRRLCRLTGTHVVLGHGWITGCIIIARTQSTSLAPTLPGVVHPRTPKSRWSLKMNCQLLGSISFWGQSNMKPTGFSYAKRCSTSKPIVQLPVLDLRPFVSCSDGALFDRGFGIKGPLMEFWTYSLIDEHSKKARANHPRNVSVEKGSFGCLPSLIHTHLGCESSPLYTVTDFLATSATRVSRSVLSARSIIWKPKLKAFKRSSGVHVLKQKPRSKGPCLLHLVGGSQSTTTTTTLELADEANRSKKTKNISTLRRTFGRKPPVFSSTGRIPITQSCCRRLFSSADSWSRLLQ